MRILLFLSLSFVAVSAMAVPRFIGAERYGVRPGHELIWRVPVVGAARVEAVSLPDGVTFDVPRRTLRGCLAEPGTYSVTLKASDTSGSCMQSFDIVVGETLCFAPPMGWNSWYSFSEAVSQAGMEKMARLLEETGLADAGWAYVNLDDCWQGERPSGEALQPNAKFPDMKALCSAIHARGLKAGIYSTPWVATYAGFRGGSSDEGEEGAIPLKARSQPGQLYGSWPGIHRRGKDHAGKFWHVDIDARQWAEWGFDYVKMDWKPNDVPTTARIARDLRTSGRDIVLSLSNAAPIAHAEGLSRYAQLWRTTGDIQDTWASIRAIGRAQLKWLPYRSIGHWNDPDILQIGRLGTPNQKNTTFRPSRLTQGEQRYQMTLWCMLSAPLFISSDLEHLSAETRALLMDADLIELDQKYAAAPILVVTQTPQAFILRKDIGPGKHCVYGLFNDSDMPQALTLPSGETFVLAPHEAHIHRTIRQD